MIQLYINGKQAIPKADANIKFTKENAYFTKSSSYTYDVELPMAIAENRRIFGMIHRMDVAVDRILADAVLVVDGVRLLSGTARITSISETSVKVQLLGELASYNYGNKMDDTYIDRLDLGDWFMTTWPDGSHMGRQGWQYYPADTHLKGTASSVFARAKYNSAGSASNQIQIQNLFSGDYPWVAFPVMNSTAEFRCNNYCFRLNQNYTAYEMELRGYNGEYAGKHTSSNPPVISGAVQPYVWVMAEKIAAATGFTLDRTDNALFTNAFLKRIFIVNANNCIECNQCLPHWTVNEWWTQIENTFGVVMSVDYDKKKIRLKERREHYANEAPTVVLANIVDEYTADVDDDSQTDISVSNVGFADCDADPGDLLSQFILDNAVFNDDFEDICELQQWASAQGSTAMASHKDTIYQCKDGRQFIYTEAEGMLEVNMFRPRLTDRDRDIEVELKFVPAKFVEGECEFYPPIPAGAGASGNTQAEKPAATVPVRILEVPDKEDMEWYKYNDSDSIDIEALISGDDEEVTTDDNSKDLIYIAIANFNKDSYSATFQAGGTTVSGVFQYPRAYLRSRGVAPLSGQLHYEDTQFSLSLIPIANQTNLGCSTLTDSARIDTKTRQCISFIADRIPDPASIFLIHNKRYVCEKIEANIAQEGLQKKLTGYFYELDL